MKPLQTILVLLPICILLTSCKKGEVSCSALYPAPFYFKVIASDSTDILDTASYCYTPLDSLKLLNQSGQELQVKTQYRPLNNTTYLRSDAVGVESVEGNKSFFLHTKCKTIKLIIDVEQKIDSRGCEIFSYEEVSGSGSRITYKTADLQSSFLYYEIFMF